MNVNEMPSSSTRPSFYDAFVKWLYSSNRSISMFEEAPLSDMLTCVQLLQDQQRLIDEVSRAFHSIDEPKTMLMEMIEIFQPCFCHPWSSIRRLSLNVLRLFDPHLSYIKLKNEDESRTVFSILLDAENTPATMDTYRQRVAILRKLKYGSHSRYLPLNFSNELLENLILRFYLAQLFDNFTLLWPMVAELVESYAYGLPIDQFWAEFGDVLLQVTRKIHSFETLDQESTQLMSQFESEKQIVPDYFSFRLQLFKLLGGFTDVAERRTKILSPVLIDLYRDEFQPSDNSSQRTEDLTSNRNVEEAPESVEAENVQKPQRYGRKRTSKALQLLLNVFAQFSSAKSVFRESEIREIYEELLLSSEPELQKAALNCVFSYRFKFLTPYRENFENIIDEKKFRDELVRFTIDEQNSVVEEEHRLELMPFLMRLLYGKLQAHVATRGQTKRAAIFRYLASCRPSELDVFFNVLFRSLSGIFDISKLLNLSSFCETIANEYKPKQTIPLRKVQR
uniref:U3 small nucleolar RNA-associated protein 20 N-terminal domain-containing protein n=2 Tax=Acrobeloides nanus TaxID=290746 RepID=A0A914DM99_9BILA